MDETEQKKKIQIEIKIKIMSKIFSLVVFAIKLRCTNAGKKRARGAHRNDPISPRNLSILSARHVATTMAETQTINLDKFCIQ